MNAKEKKKIVLNEIKKVIMPYIKELGFSGSFPHFRRKNLNEYEFISFQFNRNGGSFILEAAYTNKNDIPDFAKELPFEKLNYGYTKWNKRIRIKPDGSEEDFWFSFENLESIEKIKNLIKPLKDILKNNINKFFNNKK